MSRLEKLVLLIVNLGIFAAGAYGAYRAYESVAKNPNKNTPPGFAQVEGIGAAGGVIFGAMFLVSIFSSIFGVRGNGVYYVPWAYYGYPFYATWSLFWYPYFNRFY